MRRLHTVPSHQIKYHWVSALNLAYQREIPIPNSALWIQNLNFMRPTE